jgi:hypothetical protein
MMYKSEAYAYLLVLDTRTKKFSTSIRLLASMREPYNGNMRVMRSEDVRGAPDRGHGVEVARAPCLASRQEQERQGTVGEGGGRGLALLVLGCL